MLKNEVYLSSRLRRTSDREDALLSRAGCLFASVSAWFLSNCDLIEARLRFRPSRSSMVLPVPPFFKSNHMKINDVFLLTWTIIYQQCLSTAYGFSNMRNYFLINADVLFHSLCSNHLCRHLEWNPEVDIILLLITICAHNKNNLVSNPSLLFHSKLFC